MIASVLLVAALFYASYSIRSGVYVKAHCRARTKERVAALTFDDGPHPERTPRILDILRERGVKAAFFVKGENAERWPEIIDRMVAEGHLVGNHTYSHSGRFPLLSARNMVAEMERCDAAIERITGSGPRFFRPPFGVTNPMLRRAIKRRGYEVIGWSVRSLDTFGGPREKPAKRVFRALRPGAVILLHDDRPQSDELLTTILSGMAARDYRTERADNLLGLDKQ